MFKFELPIAKDRNGVVRVANSRVTLDTIVEAFLEGESAESIVEQYPVIQLADAYAIIAYYLSHRDQVDAYLHQRERQHQDAREQIENRSPQIGIRARLLARRKSAG